MAFSIVCTNKGCYNLMAPYIDPSDDKVYCSECDKEVVNITHFIKSQLKSNKQFKQKKPTSFSVKCQSCGKEDRPIIVNDDIVCASCKKTLSHLTNTFKLMLKEMLKSVSKDV